jgi:hypothetical protein
MEWAIVAGRRILAPAFADRGVSRGQSGDIPRMLTSVFYIGAPTFSFKLRPMYTQDTDWTPFQTNSYSENIVVSGIEPSTSGSIARNSGHYSTEAVKIKLTEHKYQMRWTDL